MSIQWMDGFDHYTSNSLNKWDHMDTTVGTTGRFGGKAYRPDVNGLFAYKNLASNFGTLIVGFAVNHNGNSGTDAFFAFQDVGSTQIYLHVNGLQHVEVVRGDGTVLLDTGYRFIFGIWNWIEFKVVFSTTTTGSFEVRAEGITIGTQSSVKTTNSGNAFASRVFIGSCGGFAGTNFDDFYCVDSGGSVNNTFLGDSKIETKFPTSDNTVAWTTSGGNNFGVVNNNPDDGDTSFVSSSTVSQTDLYGVAGFQTGGNIAAVQVNMNARKDDAGLRQIASRVKSGATTVSGATVTMLSTYLLYPQMYETDPNTSALWTPTNLNSALFGEIVIA